MATAQIQPLAWELPYAAGVALKRQKIQNYMVKLNSKDQKSQSQSYRQAFFESVQDLSNRPAR